MAMLLCSISAIAQTEEEYTQEELTQYPKMYSEEWERERDRIVEEWSNKYKNRFTFMGEKDKIDVYEYMIRGLGKKGNNMSPSQNVRCVKRRSSASNTAVRQQRVREAREANARLATQSWQRMREAQAAAKRRKKEEEVMRRRNYQSTYQETYNTLQPVADVARNAVYQYADKSLQREQNALESGGSAVKYRIDGNVKIGNGEVATTYSQRKMDELQSILDKAENEVAALDDLDILQELGNYDYSDEEPVIPEDIDQKYYLTIGGVPYVDEDGRYVTFTSEEEAQQELASFMSEWEQRVDSYDVPGGLKGNVLEAGREDISKIAKIVPPKQMSMPGTDGDAKDTTVSTESGVESQQKSTPASEVEDNEY